MPGPIDTRRNGHVGLSDAGTTQDSGSVNNGSSVSEPRVAARVAMAATSYSVTPINRHPSFAGTVPLNGSPAVRFATAGFSSDVADRKALAALDAFARMILSDGQSGPQARETV